MISTEQLVRKALEAGFDAGLSAYTLSNEDATLRFERALMAFRAKMYIPNIMYLENSDTRPPVEASTDICSYHRWEEIEQGTWKCKFCLKMIAK